MLSTCFRVCQTKTVEQYHINFYVGQKKLTWLGMPHFCFVIQISISIADLDIVDLALASTLTLRDAASVKVA